MKHLIYLIILFIFLSCNNEIPSQIKAKVISINLHNDNFGRAEIQKIIPLENGLESFIGRIARIKFVNDKIYILDANRNKLMVFFEHGKFYKTTKNGKGPGEMLDPIDYYINPTKHVIYVKDVMNDRFVLYDLNLNHIKTYSTKSLPIGWFTIINKDKILAFIGNNLSLSTQDYYTYAVYNENFQAVKNGLLPFYDEDLIGAMTTYNPISREFSNDILLCKPFDQNIYILDTNSMSVNVKYFLDFGEYNMETTYLDDILLLGQKLSEGEFAKILGDIINTDELLITSLAFNQKQEYIIYFKESGQVRSSLADSDLPYGYIKGITEDNELIMAVEAIDLIDFIKRTGYDYPLGSIDESDNIYLLLFKFKFDET